MAIDVYSEKFSGINSPSFSFSNDNPNDYNPCRLLEWELDHSVLDSPFDFAFNVDTSISSQSSTADELFSNGKLIPTGVKQEIIQAVPCLDSESDSRFESRKKSLKEFLEDFSEDEEPNIAAAKPFWMFRRSNSLNCDRNPKKAGLIGPSKILSRSGSTGTFLDKIFEENLEKKHTSNSNRLSFFRKFSRNNSLSSDRNVSSEVLRRSTSTSDNYFSKSDSKLFRRSKSTGSAPSHVRNKQQQQQERFPSSLKPTRKGQVNQMDRRKYYSNSWKERRYGLSLLDHLFDFP